MSFVMYKVCTFWYFSHTMIFNRKRNMRFWYEGQFGSRTCQYFFNFVKTLTFKSDVYVWENDTSFQLFNTLSKFIFNSYHNIDCHYFVGRKSCFIMYQVLFIFCISMSDISLHYCNHLLKVLFNWFSFVWNKWFWNCTLITFWFTAFW